MSVARTRAVGAFFAILLAAPFAIPAPVPKGAATDKKPTVAYVYQADKASAEAFKKFLDAEGLATDLVTRDAVEKTDFAKYGLIGIGSDTEDTTWGNASGTIERSGKPVLGLGEGGYSFLGKEGLKLDIGAPHGWHGELTSVIPVDADKSPLWMAAEIPANKPVKLYTQSGHVGIHLPKPPTGVVLLGREETDDAHYPVVAQGRCALWGFTGGPADMTADGKKVFVATCRYTAALAQVAEKKM